MLARRHLLSCWALPIAAACVLGSSQANAQDVAIVSSHNLTTALRSLSGCPRKCVITSAAGWGLVTAGLEQAPPMPNFDRYECVLVIADASHEATSRVDGIRRRGEDLEVTLTRHEPDRPERTDPSLECFFLIVEPFSGGVHVRHRTELEDDMGFIEFEARPAQAQDRLQAALPRLGPDLRLLCEMADGSPLPPDLELGIESTFERDIRPPVRTRQPFVPSLRFLRMRDGVQHRLVVFNADVVSRNDLILRELPPPGPDGAPDPIEHRFVLEPLR
jgi:hypothetical protein